MDHRISVIVLHSAGRDAHLARALTALFAQRHSADEVVVVSDRRMPLDLRVKWVQVEGANIAASRNAGLAHTTGDLVAFCDDDAAPEPGWLQHLVPSFADQNVGAAGGPVRGPDGISIQWGETRFDKDGTDRVDGAYVKLNGTNMMLRRSALDDLGGFDPSFSYYLDETDYLLRMEAAGWRSVWVEAAEVHHAAAPNAIRGGTASADGFRNMGRSLAYFCQKHLPEALRAMALANFAQVQRARLLRRFQVGRIGASEFEAILDALQAGMSDPAPSEAPLTLVGARPATINAQPSRQNPKRVAIAVRILTRRKGRNLARMLAASGHDVTLMSWRWLRQPRTVRLTLDGVWHHSGGLYARGYRDWVWRRALRRELRRIQAQRAPEFLIRATFSGDWTLSSGGQQRFIERARSATEINEIVRSLIYASGTHGDIRGN